MLPSVLQLHPFFGRDKTLQSLFFIHCYWWYLFHDKDQFLDLVFHIEDKTYYLSCQKKAGSCGSWEGDSWDLQDLEDTLKLVVISCTQETVKSLVLEGGTHLHLGTAEI